MDDADLARREHENFIASVASIAAVRPNGLVRRERGVALVSAGVPLRIFNQVFVEDRAAEPADVAAAAAELAGRVDRFAVTLRSGVDDRFVAAVEALGLVRDDPGEAIPGMALHPIPPAMPPPAGLEIRHLRDSVAFADHVRVGAAGFGLELEVAESFLDPVLLDDPDAAVYAGYVDEQPVVSGAGYRTDRTIGVYNIATIEAVRRRGYAEAMTRRVIADGAAAGCDVAILQPSRMGLPVYERIGFRTVVTYHWFVQPESSGPA